MNSSEAAGGNPADFLVEESAANHTSLADRLRTPLCAFLATVASAAYPGLAEAQDAAATPLESSNTPVLTTTFSNNPAFMAQTKHGQPTRPHEPKRHHKPTEPIEVSISTLDASTNNPEATRPDTIDLVEFCGKERSVTYYNKTPQPLSRCPVGSKGSVIEGLPTEQLSDPNYQLLHIKGGDTRRFRVGRGPVDIQFTNIDTPLNPIGRNAYGGYYYYVTGLYTMSASGLSADMEQARPKLGDNSVHSLAEIALQSGDGNQIVEMGWTVEPERGNHPPPRLFVSRWVDRQPACIDGCGGFVFLPNPDHIAPGDAVQAGVTANYQIAFSTALNGWEMSYNGNAIGYFPASIWGDGFTEAVLESAFGEVESTSGLAPCAQMGDGKFGSQPGSTSITNINVINGSPWPTDPLGANLQVSSSVRQFYNAGNISPTGFTFGGQGAGSSAGC